MCQKAYDKWNCFERAAREKNEGNNSLMENHRTARWFLQHSWTVKLNTKLEFLITELDFILL
jgi:hypothetical protein